MKQRFLLLLMVCFSYTLTTAQNCWNLVWSDEFNGTSLNSADWSYDTGAGFDGGWGNNEQQYYTNTTNNLFVTGGYLNLKAMYSANYAGSGKNFTSGRIHSRNKQSWTYGRFEASMKLPTGTGTWPAFWMLPENSPYGGWPTGGEIDIMEYRGDLTATVNGTLHYGNASPNNQYDGTGYSLSSGNFASGFHLFAVEWEPNEIRWYVDGTLYKTETKTPNSLNPASNNAVKWPWDNNFYVILNLAVGGWYTGNPSQNSITGGNTSWSATAQVDYVRVYTDLSGGALTGEVAGKSSVVSAETGLNYTIPSTAAATYAWTVTNGTINSGQGTNTISVTWGTTSGSVSVTKTIGCGNATYTLPVTILPTKCGVMLDDYENTRFSNYGFINGQLSQKVINPASSVENTSPYCAQYIRNPSEQYDVLIIENPGLGDADLIENNTKRLVMDVYSNAAGRNVEITLENSNTATPSNYPTGRHSTYRATTTKVNEWETLTFVLVTSPEPGLVGTNVNRLVVLFSPNTYTNTTFYFDNILLDDVPVVPTISGAVFVCTNQTNVPFNVPNVAGSTYVWSLPSGASFVSGQGTNSIVVNFASAGNLTLQQTSSGGCAAPLATKSISTSAAFTTPSISGSGTACFNQTGTTYSVATTSGATYAWTVPTDATITSGQGTNSITVDFGTSSGNITVQQTNSNNCVGTVQSKTITNSSCATGVLDADYFNLEIFPNPTQESLTIKTNAQSNQGYQIDILESTGKVLLSYQYATLPSEGIQLSMNTLKTGYYLVRVSDGEHFTVKGITKR